MKIGVAKADITAFYKDAGMLGYAMYFHIMRGIETPLIARAYIFEDETKGDICCIVNCEVCFITPALKTGVLKMLNDYHPEFGIKDENLLICAQHTHCAPGGYSHHPLYNTSVPGFIVEVYEKIVNGIFESIVKAYGNRVPATISLGKSKFDEAIPVNFNRQINAYNLNEDVSFLPYEKRHLATDREMILLNFTSTEGKPLGSINWFGVHTTSLSNNFLKVCSDNKGYAATYLEQDMQSTNPDYIGSFAQGSCGDISPKFKYNPKHPFTRGKMEGYYPDDLKSAQYNGQLQFEKAKEILKETDNTDSHSASLDYGIMYSNFGLLDIDPKYSNGKEGCVTSPSCMGVSMLEGSKHDGPGMHPSIGVFARALSRSIRMAEKAALQFADEDRRKRLLRKFEAKGVKDIVLEADGNKVYGARHPRKFFLPGFLDEMIRNIKEFDRRGAYKFLPFTPQVLPLQIVRLGDIAICTLPFEITVVASFRLKKFLAEQLKELNINQVILCPYSNAYSGYITTYEEYQYQGYEAGHCVFGQYSLFGVMQQYDLLINNLKKERDKRVSNREILPKELDSEALEALKYYKGHYTLKVEKKDLKAEKKTVKKAT